MKLARQLFNNITSAHWTCIIAYICASVLACIDIQLTIIPLSLFLIICISACFIPQLGFYLPVISKGNAQTGGIAITFDDGPDSELTPLLLEVLSFHKIPATFFVTGKSVHKNPEIIKRIINEEHSIGNHSYSHDNLLMLRSKKKLLSEIKETQKVLLSHGIITYAFRPPVGITNPKLGSVLKEMGLFCINFNRRSFDRGNKNINNIARIILNKVRYGDIIMLHDIKYGDYFKKDKWLHEVDALINGIKERGIKILPLCNLIDRPVMKKVT